jgi:hypothetical protein
VLAEEGFCGFPVGGRGKSPLPIVFPDMKIESDFHFLVSKGKYLERRQKPELVNRLVNKPVCD